MKKHLVFSYNIPPHPSKHLFKTSLYSTQLLYFSWWK